MHDALQIITGILFLILVFILTRYGMAWRIKRACVYIVKDLDSKKALDPGSAVHLPYAKTDHFRMGLKDFRPKAIQGLLQAEIVGITAEGKYYLRKRPEELGWSLSERR